MGRMAPKPGDLRLCPFCKLPLERLEVGGTYTDPPLAGRPVLVWRGISEHPSVGTGKDFEHSRPLRCADRNACRRRAATSNPFPGEAS